MTAARSLRFSELPPEEQEILRAEGRRENEPRRIRAGTEAKEVRRVTR